MKWIKRNWWIVIISVLSIYLLFSARIGTEVVEITYNELMDEAFINLFKYKIENVNFIQIILVLGINYCAFYYMISIMLDFTKGVKDLVRYTSKNLFIFDLKMFRLITVQYIFKFLCFISITLFCYIFIFNKLIGYQDILFIILWCICDISVLYIIQRFNNVEGITIFLLSMYFLGRKYILNFLSLLVVMIVLHWIYDKFRKEK